MTQDKKTGQRPGNMIRPSKRRYAALSPRFTGGVLARAQPTVAGDLTAILESIPADHFHQQGKPSQRPNAPGSWNRLRFRELLDVLAHRRNLPAQKQRLALELSQLEREHLWQ